jgi:Glyoxalase/Bleomycin resistance protein/Dioxygenase superfamily
MTSTNDFPTSGVELRYLLVASDYARSLAFYCDVLGATVIRQISDVLCLSIRKMVEEQKILPEPRKIA